MPFQKRCLAWLLHREKAAVDVGKAARNATSAAAAAEQEPLHPCYRAIQLPSGIRLYVNSLTGDLMSLDPNDSWLMKGNAPAQRSWTDFLAVY